MRNIEFSGKHRKTREKLIKIEKLKKKKTKMAPKEARRKKK